MARPPKQTNDFFLFDCDFFTRPEVVALDEEFGCKGIAVYCQLLCAIFRNGCFAQWSTGLASRIAGSLAGVSESLVRDIVSSLVRRSIFSEEVFCTTGILTSADIQQRYTSQCAMQRRKARIPALINLLPTPQKTKPKFPTPPPPEAIPNSQPQLIPNSPPPPETIPNSQPAIPNSEILTPLWIETAYQKFRITPDEAARAIDEFRQHCVLSGRQHHVSAADFRRHFYYWISKNPTYNHALNNNNPQSKQLLADAVMQRLNDPRREPPSDILEGLY